MTQRPEKFVWLSLAATLAMPACLALWFLATYNGLNPYGTPDNALPRALPGLLIFGVTCLLLGSVYFLILGVLQRRRHVPSISLALLASAVISLPLPALVYFIAVAVPDPMPDGWRVVFGLFGFSFVSVGIGACVQYAKLRPNRSFKPNPPRHAIASDGSTLISPSDTTRGGSA